MYLFKYLSVILSVILVASCTLTVEDDESPAGPLSLTSIPSSAYIYGELEIRGSGFSSNCADNKVFLTKDNQSTDLTVDECSGSKIIAFVPLDLEAGDYSLAIENGIDAVTETSSGPITITIKERPVILNISSLEIPVGGTLTIEGVNFLNKTGLSVYDPTVWITKSGYTNTVSDITVNSDGTEAEITLDDDIEAGDYQFKITTDEWSNEFDLKIQ